MSGSSCKISSKSESKATLGQPILSETERKTLQLHGFRIDALLATGAFSRVYRGFLPNADHEEALAIKIVNLRDPPRFLKREIDILASIVHPHIVSLHSLFVSDGECFIVTRLAASGDLLDFIIKNGAIPEYKAKLWTKQMAEAIQYLHSRDIVHRDLKCENILLTEELHVQLADFGFAKYLPHGQLSHGYSETYCGSLSYAAPEILRARPYKSKPADLWSFGVILFIILNAQVPFDASSLQGILRLQLKRAYKFRRSLRKYFSRDVKSLVGHLLQPKVRKRYTVEEVLRSRWFAHEEP